VSLYRPKGSPYWHYDFQLAGRRFHGTTRTKSKALARRVEQAVRDAVVDPAKRRPDITLDEAFGLYFTEHAQHAKSCRDIEGKLVRLLAGLGKDELLGDLTDDAIARYISKRRAQVSDASVNREITILRAVCRRLQRRYRTPDVAWPDHRLEEPAEREPALSAHDEAILLAALPGYLRAPVAFAILTGARLATIVNLAWEDIDYQAGTITLRDVKSKRHGDVHVLPLTPELIALIANEHGKHPERVFTYRRSRTGADAPLTPTNWRRHWRKALVVAKLTGFRFHDLRHVAATRILRATGSLKLTGKVLGHASPTSTARYAHHDLADLRRALDAVSRAAESRTIPEVTASEGSPQPSDALDVNDLEVTQDALRIGSQSRCATRLRHAPTCLL
jgi:integrase